MNISKHFDWFKALEQKEQEKEKKAELIKAKDKIVANPAGHIAAKPGLFGSAYKKEMEKALFFGGSSASSGDLAYFDQPSSWKPLPGSNYYWKNVEAVQSASAYTWNYTQIFPANPYVAFEPMTIERAIELNNGVAA